LRSRVDAPHNLELHMVSQMTPQAQKAFSGEPGVHLHLGLVPNSAELISLFQQADIFCLPTKGDCLPMVLAEAGAAGLPIISTRVGGIPEIVREGENGYLIDPEDTRALVSTMERLVCDSHLRRQMGIQSRQIIATAHNTELNAARLVEIVCEVIDTSQKRK
jgi:glycosyltransferase involved in cell wall biosynthesis